MELLKNINQEINSLQDKLNKQLKKELFKPKNIKRGNCYPDTLNAVIDLYGVKYNRYMQRAENNPWYAVLEVVLELTPDYRYKGHISRITFDIIFKRDMDCIMQHITHTDVTGVKIYE